MNVHHTCHGRDHTTDLTPDTTDRLGCGCLRYRAQRCDGSRIEWVVGGCERHREQS